MMDEKNFVFENRYFDVIENGKVEYALVTNPSTS